MEKRAPHCKLPTVKALVKAGKVRATWSARTGAAAMGMGVEDIVEVILSLSAQDFYKSMTTHADHTIWQDVYRPATKAGGAYLKLTVIDEVLIVSFKDI